MAAHATRPTRSPAAGPRATKVRGTRAAARRRPGPSAQIDFYFPQQVDNSRLVKYADPRERRSQTRLVLLSVFVMALMLGAVYPRFALTRAGYRIEQLKQERDQLQEANRKLRLEEARLMDPRRIDTIARNQLGLTPAAPGQMQALEMVNGETPATELARVQPPPVPKLAIQ